MNLRSLKARLLDQIKWATLNFAKPAFTWLLLLILCRLFEFFFDGFTHQFPESPLSVLFWALSIDISFWMNSLFFLYIGYLILVFASRKLGAVALNCFVIVLCLIHLTLILYFSTSLVPLGADVYGYSLNDVMQTIGASGILNFKTIVCSLLALLFLIAIVFYLPVRLRMIPLKVSIWLLLLSIMFNIFPSLNNIKPRGFNSDYTNSLILNKSVYFYNSSYSHFFPEVTEQDIYSDSYIGDYQGGSSKAFQFKYINEQTYPFYHLDSTRDVLSPFLSAKNERPNVVLLIVEGLGRAFTNEGAYLGNFTPFIDSLSGKSLYWRNFLSEGGRTFAVLPSLVGSLPFAKNGFLELADKMPDHFSLISFMRYNGYKTSFYYGGDSKFDKMDVFLKQNHIDELNDGASFPVGYTKLPASEGFSWGYNDKELFRYYLNSRKPVADKAPEFNIILTVSTHSPFLINEQEKYLDVFEQKMKEFSFSDATKSTYRNYKLQYSSILYMDDAVRTFFNEYKKRSDYANTIFIITGDHRMPEIPMASKIDRFHVPLIIYSPLLKRTAQISSVSTHFDIAPSLLAYFKTNYKFKLPSTSSWLGWGLDTTRSFQNLHVYPLMQTKTDIIDFIMGEYHLNGNSLFRLNSNMGEEPLNDEAIAGSLKSAFDKFKNKNSVISNGGKIIPDTLYQHYIRLKK